MHIYLKPCVQQRFLTFYGEITCSTTVLQLNKIVQLVDSSGSITGLCVANDIFSYIKRFNTHVCQIILALTFVGLTFTSSISL